MHLRRVILFFFCCLFLVTIQAHPGIGLVYDGENFLYYTDLEHIWQLDTNTGKKRIYVENVHSHELVLDSKGNLYGEHYWHEESEAQFWNYIWIKRIDGSFEKIRENRIGENNDFSFVRDSEFNGYSIQLIDGRFALIKSDSTTQSVWYTMELNRPGWSYLTRNGKLLFSDYPRVYRADSEGVDVLVSDLSASRFPFSLQDKTHHIYGIWEDKNGMIYVALYGGRQVLRINTAVESEQVLSTGLLWSPVNGVFDNNEDLWLLEARMDGAVRVRKIEENQLSTGGSFKTENVVLFIVLLLILGIITRRLRRKTNLFNTVI